MVLSWVYVGLSYWAMVSLCCAYVGPRTPCSFWANTRLLSGRVWDLAWALCSWILDPSPAFTTEIPLARWQVYSSHPPLKGKINIIFFTCAQSQINTTTWDEHFKGCDFHLLVQEKWNLTHAIRWPASPGVVLGTSNFKTWFCLVLFPFSSSC